MIQPCPNGHLNRPGARFCRICGAAVGGAPAPAFCPHCRRPNLAGQPRCAYCGARLASAHTVPYIASAILPPNALLHSRYTIARWIGGGGMGAVYEAWDNHIHGRRVAVKELNAATIPNPQDLQHIMQMFQQEAQMLAHLNHPHLPRVSDFFIEGSKQYLVMDFIVGRTLEKVLEDNRAPLSEAQVIGIGIQLCNVLEYLHACQPPNCCPSCMNVRPKANGF